MTTANDFATQPSEYYGKDGMRALTQLFRPWAKRKALNVGCGRAEVLVENTTWSGIDFNPALHALWRLVGVEDRCSVADARKVPADSGEFDVTVSCDFLEHLSPGDVAQVVAELKRVAPGGVHVIDPMPESRYRTVGGHSLHPSAGLSAEWWAERFGVRSVIRYGRRYVVQY